MNPMLRVGRLTAMGIAATCALAAPALAQKDKMTPVPTPAQPNAIELGTRAASRRDGAGVLAQPVRQPLRAQRHGRDADSLSAGSVQRVRGRSGGGAGRGFPHPLDGE